MPKIHERITKTKGKVYWFIIDVGRDEQGNRIRIKRSGFTKKSDARKAIAEIESQYYAGKIFTRPSDITFYQYATEIWFNEHKYYVKVSTLKNIQSILRITFNFFGKDIKLKDITTLHFQAFAQNMLDAGKTRSHINRILAYIKLIFKHAVKNKIINTNPSENFTLPKMTLVEKTKQLQAEPKPLYLEKIDLLRFLDAAKQDCCAYPYYYIVYFLTYTGARIGEACAMEWPNLNMKNKTVKITQNIFGCSYSDYVIQTPKTKNSIREISVTQSFIDTMREWRLIQSEQKLLQANKWDRTHDFVFTSRQCPGKPVLTYTIAAFIKKIGKRIGMSWVHPHTFRHTHTSFLAAAGESLEVIQDRLGHANDTTTRQIYLHITKNRKREAASLFEKYLNAK